MGEAALQLVKPEDLAAKVEISPLISEAKAIIVKIGEHVELARDIIRQIKERRAKIDATFDESIKGAHQLHKNLLAKKKTFTDELDEAEKIIKRKIADYDIEQERIRREAEEKARKEAEAQRQRLLQAAQKKIDGAMAKVGTIEEKIAALRLVAYSTDASAEEQEIATRQINVLQLQLQGLQDKAAAAQEQAYDAAEAIAPIAAAVPAKEKTAGVGARIVLIPEVINKHELIKAVAEGKAPEMLLSVDMSALKKLVNMGVKIPGVVTTEDRIISVR